MSVKDDRKDKASAKNIKTKTEKPNLGDLGPRSAKTLSALASAAAHTGERRDRGVVTAMVTATVGRALWSGLARRLAAFCDAVGVRPAAVAPAVEPTAGWQRKLHAVRTERYLTDMLSKEIEGNKVNEMESVGDRPLAGAAMAAVPASGDLEMNI